MDDLLLHVRRVLGSTRKRKQAVVFAPQSENRCAWEVARLASQTIEYSDSHDEKNDSKGH